MLLAIIMLAATAASADPLTSMQQEGRRYEQCVQKQALLLERSGDQARVVLDAAVIACRLDRERLEDVFWVETTAKEGKPPSDARVQRVMSMVDREYKDRALPALLRQRAKRK